MQPTEIRVRLLHACAGQGPPVSLSQATSTSWRTPIPAGGPDTAWGDSMEVTQMRSSRPLDLMEQWRRVVAAVFLALALGACGSAGWSAEDRQRLASELCAQEFGVSAVSEDCRCIVGASVDNYGSPGEFTRSDAPSSAYRAALQDCGFALVPE